MKKFLVASGVAGYSTALAGLIAVATAEPAGSVLCIGFWSAIVGSAVGGLALLARSYLK